MMVKCHKSCVQSFGIIKVHITDDGKILKDNNGRNFSNHLIVEKLSERVSKNVISLSFR